MVVKALFGLNFFQEKLKFLKLDAIRTPYFVNLRGKKEFIQLSKLIILLFGFLSGNLIFSGLPTRNISTDKAGCAFAADIQNLFIPGDCEILDFSEDKNDNDMIVPKSFSDRYWQKKEDLPNKLVQALFFNRNLPPSQYSNLPPPALRVVLYS